MEDRNRILDKACKLIAQGWCQKFQATDGHGNPTAISANNAKAFCPYGAIFAVSSTSDQAKVAITSLQDVLERRTGFREVSAWNADPRRTQEQVLALLAAAKQQRMPESHSHTQTRT